ncbi:MAG TPA: hypothetical protein VFD58_30510 [Blastocatellia bacterium]|nr:hypothetical protein [Blastocatellia bacterium]
MTAEAASLYARRTADTLISSYRVTGIYLRDAVTMLCEMAAHDEPDIARAGIEGLFPQLVERLNDSFEPDYCALYDRVFAQVIEFCRRRPEAQALDAGLRRFGLGNEADILARKAGLRAAAERRPDWRKVRKVIVLSRVTLGADVSITSVILSALKQKLPDAELVLLGSGKLRQLFGDPRVRIREVAYERGGSLISRLNAWLEAVRAVDDERRGYEADETLVIDPDSRLTQLGLLPVIEGDRGYFFFESRSYRAPEIRRLSQLTERWVKKLLGISAQVFPAAALPDEYLTSGRELCQKLRRGGAGHLVSVSFGVGGNPRKRMPDPFEEMLTENLLADSTLIIDKGGSEDERCQINHLVEMLTARGRRIVELNENNISVVLMEDSIQADVITWDGVIGAFAGLVAAGDEYVGYDSAGQHIAAALGVPTLTIFINSGSDLFAERWHPHGPGSIQVLKVEPGSGGIPENEVKKILAEALATHLKLRNRTP